MFATQQRNQLPRTRKVCRRAVKAEKFVFCQTGWRRSQRVLWAGWGRVDGSRQNTPSAHPPPQQNIRPVYGQGKAQTPPEKSLEIRIRIQQLGIHEVCPGVDGGQARPVPRSLCPIGAVPREEGGQVCAPRGTMVEAAVTKLLLPREPHPTSRSPFILEAIVRAEGMADKIRRIAPPVASWALPAASGKRGFLWQGAEPQF